MKETNERFKVIEAKEFDTVEFYELDGISTFRANNIQRLTGALYENKDVNGNTVRYSGYGSCSLLSWMDGLSNTVAHWILFRENSSLTLFLRTDELASFGDFISSAEAVISAHTTAPAPTVDLSFRAHQQDVEILFNNLVNFRPELATQLEEEGQLVSWMAATFNSIKRRARQFEEPPYDLEGQGWSEAMMEYLSSGPQKEKYRALNQKRKSQMWAVIIGRE